MKKKDVVCSVCRVLAMIMIVLCHSIESISVIPHSREIGPLLAMGVEVFLLISGFLYVGKEIKDYKAWLIKSFFKLQIPAIVCILGYYVIDLITKNPIEIKRIFSHLFLYSGLGWIWEPLTPFYKISRHGNLWFLTIIFLCYLLLPILNKFKDKMIKNKELTFILLTVISVGFSFLKVRFSYFCIFCLGYLFGAIKSKSEDGKWIKAPAKAAVLSSLWFAIWIIIFIIGNYRFHQTTFYIYMLEAPCMCICNLVLCNMVCYLYQASEYYGQAFKQQALPLV